MSGKIKPTMTVEQHSTKRTTVYTNIGQFREDLKDLCVNAIQHWHANGQTKEAAALIIGDIDMLISPGVDQQELAKKYCSVLKWTTNLRLSFDMAADGKPTKVEFTGEMPSNYAQYLDEFKKDGFKKLERADNRTESLSKRLSGEKSNKAKTTPKQITDMYKPLTDNPEIMDKLSGLVGRVAETAKTDPDKALAMLSGDVVEVPAEAGGGDYDLSSFDDITAGKIKKVVSNLEELYTLGSLENSKKATAEGKAQNIINTMLTDTDRTVTAYANIAAELAKAG